MEKFLGLYKKGSVHDSYGFITGSSHSNLFIHDRQFKEDIGQIGKSEVYVTYKVRDSKAKVGFFEGYSGKFLQNEDDGDFLLTELRFRLDNINMKKFYFSESLCKVLLNQLKKIDYNIDNLLFIEDYFTEQTIQDYFDKKQDQSLFGLMQHGIKLFFPTSFEKVNSKLDLLTETRLLRELGHEGTNIYDALTEIFFNNYSLFEQKFKQFKNTINKEFIYKIIYDSETLPWDKSFNSIKRFVQLIKNNDSIIDNENAFRLFYNLSTPKIRLYLWLIDLAENFNFEEYKENVWRLEKKDQALFIKKIFYSKSKGLIDFELMHLNQIKVFDIKSFREIKNNEPDKNFYNLDFNVSLLIHLLNSFSNSNEQFFNVPSKIFEYFREYISNSRDISHIEFFYQKCIGRTTGIAKKLIDPETNEEIINPDTGLPDYDYTFKHESHDIPIFHQYCDGQTSIKPLEGFTENERFSWCAGLPCFGCAIDSDRIPSNFQDLTIKDFLSILKIPYKPIALAHLSGYVNKANLLIDRIQCTSCNSILTPAVTSTTTHHMINMFYCGTKTCSEYKKEIYLNHCLNKYCSNVIDSRLTKKCTHEGYKDFCGWYICDFCYSCCSSDTFRRIIEKKKLQGKKYNCSSIGHDELKVIFCYHCGSTMGLNIEFYKRQLDIINNLKSESCKHLLFSSKEKDGLWSFVLDFSSFRKEKRIKMIEELIHYGFKVVEGTSKHFAYLLTNIALKCTNENCSNEEIFSPIKREELHSQNYEDDLPFSFNPVSSVVESYYYIANHRWKPFTDSHKYLFEKIKRLYLEKNIDILSE